MEIYLLLLLLSVQNVLSANILYVSSVPSPSHHIWNRALAFGLANKGHNVTLIGPDKDKVQPANYSHLHTEGLYEAFHEATDMLEVAELSELNIILEFVDFCLIACNATLKSQGLQQLLNYPPNFKFDLIIVDITVGNCLLPLIKRFNYPPVVAVTPFLLPSYVANTFGNHLYPSYVPWYGLPHTNNMTFKQRFWNYFYTYVEVIYKYFVQYKEEHRLAKSVFGENTPPIQELERHISLVLSNSDPILDYPQPLAPNIISVGGLHTRKPKEIPQEYKKILDNAKNGIIVFSLGSNIRSDSLDKKKQKALLEAFSKLSETVIWKFESELENIPKNVIIRKWLPQNDILAHPNVKLFIGHGGALSTQEAIFHGVPIICVPFFFDQHVNTKNVVNRQIGIFFDYKKITANYVLEKIKEVLDNPIYSQNMKKVSDIFGDRMETPLERAIFWVEHTLRHQGVHYLNTPARVLPFYKSSGLDIMTFVILILIIVYLILRRMFKKILSMFINKKKVKVH